jgi:hypothetical protein
MVADGWCPDAATSSHLGVRRKRHIPYGMIHQSPVDQIARLENGKPRCAIEAGCGHPEILSDADHIEVRVIRVDHWVGIGSVSPVGNPRVAF